METQLPLHSINRLRAAVIGCLILAVGFVHSIAAGAATQDPPRPQTIPDSEAISLETKDGVVLRCEWFPGTSKKESVPVILLHDWNGKRQDMLPLAGRLQRELGCAVLVPDWRGHGESLELVSGGPRLDRERFGRVEFASMVEDIETCKRFLRDKNNAGELNIDMLCVVATHQLCTPAVAWTISDWNWPLYAGKRQGQDAKVLVLISPLRRYKWFVMNDYLRVPPIAAGPVAGVCSQIVYGADDATTATEARAILEALEKGRPTDIPADAKYELGEVFAEPFATQLVGAALIDSPDSNVVSSIVSLIKGKLVDRASKYPWLDRKIE